MIRILKKYILIIPHEALYYKVEISSQYRVLVEVGFRRRHNDQGQSMQRPDH